MGDIDTELWEETNVIRIFLPKTKTNILKIVRIMLDELDKLEGVH